MAFSAGKRKRIGVWICAGSLEKNCDQQKAKLRKKTFGDRAFDKTSRNRAENFDQPNGRTRSTACGGGLRHHAPANRRQWPMRDILPQLG